MENARLLSLLAISRIGCPEINIPGSTFLSTYVSSPFHDVDSGLFSCVWPLLDPNPLGSGTKILKKKKKVSTRTFHLALRMIVMPPGEPNLNHHTHRTISLLHKIKSH